MMAMHSRRRVLSTLLVLLGLAGCLLVPGPRQASATTGATYFLPPARYHVASRLARLYRGQYVLKTVARSTHLSGGALGIEINDRGDLYGVGQFYGYDARGEQTSWVATLYNFHPGRHAIMTIDLVGPAGRPLLGRLFVSRNKHGDLVGQIELGQKRYSLSWRKISTR
jgi:hypothetical protein